MRVGRWVENWIIVRALNEASRGALAPGPAQPVDSRRTMGPELDHRSRAERGEPGCVSPGLLIRHAHLKIGNKSN